MDAATISEYCARLHGATEGQPFGPEVDVFKVGGKMFAILSPDETPARISLKCEPMLALALRERYGAVTPGYHLSKQHWNTIVLDGSIPDDEVIEMVDHSYDRIVASLTKAARRELFAEDD